ncbi:MAG: hypothetical protein BWY70_01191 [Bacteroidetes bacterium ADurb.Bin408]|nr:MAG: hypothetical protein BWY70_01191 [Bacteroidetes bacterium ADurb.Bin408]
MWHQKTLSLKPRTRGFHLITAEIEANIPELKTIKTGLAHLFIKHTSASLTLNENADPDVQTDLETHFSKTAPENAPYYRHCCEGSDDMPAHIKCSLLGASLTIPVTNGRFNLGTWQGIYLCEHRNRAGSRQVVITLNGE